MDSAQARQTRNSIIVCHLEFLFPSSLLLSPKKEFIFQHFLINAKKGKRKTFLALATNTISVFPPLAHWRSAEKVF